jgi:hypothetical protein
MSNQTEARKLDLSQRKENSRLAFPAFEARFFILVALAITFYFIAGNTGSGWIYLLSATLITAVIMGFILPVSQVCGVNLKQEAPRQLVAGEQATVMLTVGPRWQWLPIRWLRLSYKLKTREKPSGPDKTIAVSSLDGPAHITLNTEPLPRGLHQLGTVCVSSCFPIGLVWWQRQFSPGYQTMTVYPQTAPVDGFFLYKLQPSMAASGGPSRGRLSARQSTSTRGVREYVRGDSPRIVHWASTARTGRLLVREFEAEGMPQFDVLLDLHAPWQNQDQFELAVVTASSLLSLGHRLGIAPDLLLNPESFADEMDLPPTPPGIELQMEILARVNPIKPPPKPDICWQPPSRGERVQVLIQPEGARTVRGGSSYIVEIATDTNKTLQLVVSDYLAASRESSGLSALVNNLDDIMQL